LDRKVSSRIAAAAVLVENEDDDEYTDFQKSIITPRLECDEASIISSSSSSSSSSNRNLSILQSCMITIPTLSPSSNCNIRLAHDDDDRCRLHSSSWVDESLVSDKQPEMSDQSSSSSSEKYQGDDGLLIDGVLSFDLSAISRNYRKKHFSIMNHDNDHHDDNTAVCSNNDICHHYPHRSSSSSGFGLRSDAVIEALSSEFSRGMVDEPWPGENIFDEDYTIDDDGSQRLADLTSDGDGYDDDENSSSSSLNRFRVFTPKGIAEDQLRFSLSSCMKNALSFIKIPMMMMRRIDNQDDHHQYDFDLCPLASILFRVCLIYQSSIFMKSEYVRLTCLNDDKTNCVLMAGSSASWAPEFSNLLHSVLNL
jgi:hypothetical protein